MVKVLDRRQHAGSSKSVRPLPSSSMQLPQISEEDASGPVQPAMVVLWQTPASQESVVQGFPSLQMATVELEQALQLELMAVWRQTPASHVSVVQAFPSSQSAGIEHGLHPSTLVLEQTPLPWQKSTVQGLWSSQPASVEQGTQPSIE